MRTEITMQPRKHEDAKKTQKVSFSRFRVFVAAFGLIATVQAQASEMSITPIARDGRVLVSFANPPAPGTRVR